MKNSSEELLLWCKDYLRRTLFPFSYEMFCLSDGVWCFSTDLVDIKWTLREAEPGAWCHWITSRTIYSVMSYIKLPLFKPLLIRNKAFATECILNGSSHIQFIYLRSPWRNINCLFSIPKFFSLLVPLLQITNNTHNKICITLTHYSYFTALIS